MTCALLFAGVLPAKAAGAEEPVLVDVFGSLLSADGDATSASTSFTRDDLASPGISTADVLAGAPSVAVARTGGSADLATATLRGATSAETPVYLGPILLNDDLTGTADLSTVPPSLLQSIEVFRGHAPIELERSGLGGAIVLHPFLASGTRVGVRAAAGSFGERSVAGEASLGAHGSAATIAVNLSQTGGSFSYLDDRGTRFDPSDDVEVERKNADARAIDIWSAAHLSLADSASIDLFVRGYAREQGVPGLGVRPAARARAKTQGFFGALSSQVGCGEGCNVELSAWGRTSSYQLTDPDGELLFSARRQKTSATSAGSRLAIALAPARWLELKSGASLGLGTIAVDPLGEAEARARRTTLRSYAALVARPVEWLEARVEGAVASDTLSSGAALLSQTTPSGRLGVAFMPTEGVSLYLTGARYGRVPTLGEQFGVSGTVLGNPDLRPEAGLAADTGARAELDVHRQVSVGAELTGFIRSATDRIGYERSSFGALRPFNLDSARVFGLEATLAARFFHTLEAGAAITVSDPRDTSAGRTTENDRLPFEAPLTVAPTLGLRARDLVREVRWDNAMLRALLVYRAARTADPAGLIELPSQVLLDLEGSVGFNRGTIEIAARVSNVIDDHTTDLVGYPLPGRAGHVSIGAKWQ